MSIFNSVFKKPTFTSVIGIFESYPAFLIHHSGRNYFSVFCFVLCVCVFFPRERKKNRENPIGTKETWAAEGNCISYLGKENTAVILGCHVMQNNNHKKTVKD